MIQPEEMRKISITGPKSQLSTIVDSLHDLGILHIDDYSKEDGELDIGDPQDNTEEVSQLLIRLRSIRSQMPAVDSPERDDTGLDVETQLEELQFSLNEIHEDLEEVQEEKELKESQLKKLRVLQRLELDPEDVEDYRRLDTYIGTVSNFSFKEALPEGRYELYQDSHLIGLFVDSDVDISDALRESGFDPIDLSNVYDIEGSIANEIGRLQDQVWNLKEQEDELEDELNDLAQDWRGYLDFKERELMETLQKAEIPLQFATTKTAFSAEGWIPADMYDTVVQELEAATDDRVHIEELESNEHEAPVKHDNPAGIDHFESLLKLYGTPSYREVDPTFLLITFPLLFGFMLGDVGYGLGGLILFYFMYTKMPEAKGLWFSLMYASFVAIIFGLLYGGETFGFHFFGEGNDLHTWTGMEIWAQIPTVFDRPNEFGAVMAISLIVGIVHVNFGILVGAYNEYIRHGLLEAIFAKISWLVIQAGIAVWYVPGNVLGIEGPWGPVGGVVSLLGVVMLFKGEGVEGVVEIPSLLSNILSYLRMLGVSIAVVALAKLVNDIATPLFQSGSLAMIGLGATIIIVGHFINTFIKIMEAGLQGIRLHYVEFFTKFFHGGGEYYRPFGTHHIKKS